MISYSDLQALSALYMHIKYNHMIIDFDLCCLEGYI